MLRVKQFNIKAKEPTKIKTPSDVQLNSTNGQSFIFQDSKEADMFSDELRQSFEFIMPFGCEVSYVVLSG